MRESLIHIFEFLPPEWTTFVIATLPVIELRGAIPYAASVGLSWETAYIMAVLGNLLPTLPILMFLGPVSNFLYRLPGFGRFFDWLFHRARKRKDLIDKYGPWGLAVFVAIPLPVTGAWTGCAIAYVFGIPFRRAFPAILVGVLTAGVVMTLAVQGVLGVGGLIGGH